MELRQLRYFRAVALNRSFHRAAEEVHVAQPAVSQQIRRLEAELGVALFERRTRPIRLTYAGERLLGHANRILDDVERANSDLSGLRGLLRGRITIGAIQWLTLINLADVLSRFHDRSPGIEAHLRIGATAELLDTLARGELDLALAHVDLAGGRDGFASEILLTDRLVLMVSPDHRLLRKGSVSLSELASANFVSFKLEASVRRALDSAAAEASFEPRILFEVSDLSTAIGLVSRGVGVAVVPRAAAELGGRSVGIVDLEGEGLEHNIGLIWSENHPRSAAAQAFLEFARSQLPGGGLHRMIESRPLYGHG